MSGYHGPEKCPGSGKRPLQVRDLGSPEAPWELGTCPVCGRGMCELTKAGLLYAHKGYPGRPSLSLLRTTVQAAQELLEEAHAMIDRLEPNLSCTMDSDCPNR